jgi:hypothetical protein
MNIPEIKLHFLSGSLRVVMTGLTPFLFKMNDSLKMKRVNTKNHVFSLKLQKWYYYCATSMKNEMPITKFNEQSILKKIENETRS